MNELTKAQRIDGQLIDRHRRMQHIATIWGMDEVADDMQLRINYPLTQLHGAALIEDTTEH